LVWCGGDSVVEVSGGSGEIKTVEAQMIVAATAVMIVAAK